MDSAPTQEPIGVTGQMTAQRTPAADNLSFSLVQPQYEIDYHCRLPYQFTGLGMYYEPPSPEQYVPLQYKFRCFLAIYMHSCFSLIPLISQPMTILLPIRSLQRRNTLPLLWRQTAKRCFSLAPLWVGIQGGYEL